jgi:hypothetical protein
MRNDHPNPRAGLASVAAALVLVAGAQAGADGDAVLLLPSPDGRTVVVTAPPPPAPGWERPEAIAVVGPGAAEGVLVYSPPPAAMPAARRLEGVDIRTHGIAQPGGVPTHSWNPAAPTRIAYHDWRSADAARIPTARSGRALVAQSWNPDGERFVASRIRQHGWPR